ncbi:MAG: replication restart helicase PriA [Solirubrobacteraceae bacterium]
MIARVIPLTQARAIKGLFDYTVPPELAPVAVGDLLRVPFAGRELVAVVAETAGRSELPPERLASVLTSLPASLPPELVWLADWLASEYCSTPARALGVLLPPGASKGLAEQRVLTATLTDAGRAALQTGPSDRPLTPGQLAALHQLAQHEALPAAEIGTPLLRRLEARGLVAISSERSVRRVVTRSVSSTSASAPPLTGEQAGALGPVMAALAQRDAHTESAGPVDSEVFLLHGVTGSGKTEIYLQAAQATLAQGRSVIILVPEIGLTPQALSRFQSRLGDVVAVQHSGMSDRLRYQEWLRLLRGQARVCVGARSAVFAPLDNIGLIVIDEEHESSYKHEGDPRYDARAVARHRAATHGAVLLSGSATPRPESFFGMQRLRLSRRVDGRKLPEVQILDMRGLHNPLHPQARLALADCRREGGKAIVLLNRRGWSNFLSCGSCGHVWGCPNCDVSLVLHRAQGLIACHHCGHRERLPTSCPECGSVSVSRHGAGTERLEHELRDALAGPDFPVMRLDADTSGADARASVLERFHKANAGVLVGTQMIAKGHDFADVALGVVLDADQTLRFPDFRSEERTFALLTQLAGRTGRGGGASRTASVLVQTWTPQARPIVLAARHDSETFLRGELRRRKALGYPPFTTMIRVVCSAAVPEHAAAAAAALKLAIQPSNQVAGSQGAGFTVLGPASLFMLRGRARAQLVVKAVDRAAAIGVVGRAVDDFSGQRAGRGVTLAVDVDPQ